MHISSSVFLVLVATFSTLSKGRQNEVTSTYFNLNYAYLLEVNKKRSAATLGPNETLKSDIAK